MGKPQPPRRKARRGLEFAPVGVIAACVGLALLVSGCDPNEKDYLRRGIGTELYTANTASATELQNIYLDYLCRQSGSFVGADVPSCAQQVIPANVWPLIVQAGMNDIDARCDSYLAWLDQKKRENAAILAEIGSVRFAIDALTNPNVTGVSAVGLAAISAAFGLATNTVNNFNSLLLQVDHTTVQNVVTGNRLIFRQDLTPKVALAIDNKPAAVHTLRTYLSICMPMTIAANINSTVTVFQQTGGVGGGIIPPTLNAPFTPREPITPRQPPQGPVAQVDNAQLVIAGYPGNARTFTPEVIGSILTGLCAPDSEKTKITQISRTLVEIWEQTDTIDATPNGKIDTDRERQVLIALPQCPVGILNAFERQTFSNPNGTMKSAKILTDLLDRAPPSDGLPNSGMLGNASLQDTRQRVVQLRRDCFADIKKLPPSMNQQVTQDFMKALKSYSDKRGQVSPPAPLPPC